MIILLPLITAVDYMTYSSMTRQVSIRRHILRLMKNRPITKMKTQGN